MPIFQLITGFLFFMFGSMTLPYSIGVGQLLILIGVTLLGFFAKRYLQHGYFKFLSTGAGLRNLAGKDVDEAARLLRDSAASWSQSQVLKVDNLVCYRNTGLYVLAGKGRAEIHPSKLIVSFSSSSMLMPTPHSQNKKWTEVEGFELTGWLSIEDTVSIKMAPASNAGMIHLWALINVFKTIAKNSETGTVDPSLHNISSTLERVADALQQQKSSFVSTKEFDFEPLTVEMKSEREYKARRPTIGRTVEGWKLIEKLGQGGFGEVYRAERELNGHTQQVALKILVDDFGKSDEASQSFKKMFSREAHISKGIAPSPYVIGAIDFGVEPRPWIAYPFLEGKDLAKYIGRKALPRDKWWSIAFDLVSAVDHLDKEGVLHRDIKPENIMIVDDRAILLDLGLGTVGLHDFTQSFMGTHGWQPPELGEVVTTREITSASDIYAVGLCLFYGIKGAPFPLRDMKKGESWPDFVFRKPPSMDGLNFEESELLSNMLMFRPEDRATPEELLDMIQKQIDVDELENAAKSSPSFASFSALDLFEKGFDSDFQLETTVEESFGDWSILTDILRDIVISNEPKKFELRLVVQKNGVLRYTGHRQRGGWLLEVGHEYWAGAQLGDQYSKTMTAKDWEPPTGSTPDFHKYLLKPDQIAEISKTVIDHYELVLKFNLSQLVSIRLNVEGRGFRPLA